MSYRTKPHNTLVKGEWLAQCDVCDFRFHASDLKKRWDDLMVCKDDWEIRHPQDFVRGVPDNQNVPWSRPDNAPLGSSCGPSNVAGQAVAGCAITGHFLTYSNPL